ncbi:MAG: glycosyltransferase family 4 protein [Candidatus Bathyarchaeota archaeon]|nr:glycosyltransferase family 4 protein [Candidatus Bathyarchaeota archaeon]MDH5495674.1 glycosyltransferase family 4 protein [Candidatus Bathyarchaeota archaeon]
MKTCFASFEYPPSITGGAGVYAKFMSRELAKLGHEVHVISPTTEHFFTRKVENDLIVHRIPIIDRPLLKIPSYWLKLRRFYKELDTLEGFDLLHGNVTSDLSLTKNLVKIPRVVTIHHLARSTFQMINPSCFEMLQNPEGEVGIAAWLEKETIDFDKRVITRADKVITVSNFVKRCIVNIYRIPESKIEVIYNGICQDYEPGENDILQMRNKYGSNGSIVLFVGRLEKRKGLPFLLKAFKTVSKSTKSTLVIAGSGRVEPFRSLATALGIGERVAFTSFVDYETLKKLYHACDVFVLPSLLEGFGLTILEAMAAGKPIVAFNVGGIPEVMRDDVHGRLIDPKKPNELANAIIYFIENAQLSVKVGKRNRDYVAREFSWKKTAKQTERLYRSLIR